MAFKIEKALTTMFAAFKLQSQGNLPSTLNPDVQAVIDLNTHALAAAGCEGIAVGGSSGPFALGIVGTTIIAEDWFVVGASVGYASSVAAQQGNMELDFLSPGGSSQFAIASYSWPGIIASTAAGEAIYQNGGFGFFPFWARKGSTFTGVVTSRAGPAGGQFQATVLAYRFRP